MLNKLLLLVSRAGDSCLSLKALFGVVTGKFSVFFGGGGDDTDEDDVASAVSHPEVAATNVVVDEAASSTRNPFSSSFDSC